MTVVSEPDPPTEYPWPSICSAVQARISEVLNNALYDRSDSGSRRLASLQAEGMRSPAVKVPRALPFKPEDLKIAIDNKVGWIGSRGHHQIGMMVLHVEVVQSTLSQLAVGGGRLKPGSNTTKVPVIDQNTLSEARLETVPIMFVEGTLEPADEFRRSELILSAQCHDNSLGKCLPRRWRPATVTK